MSASNRVSELRQASGFSRRDVAAELETTERTIYRWESGEVGIPDRQKLALADLLGVSVPWLMGWPDQPSNGEAA